MPEFTAEQLAAVERRDGELLLDAQAGSGKTSVLVERFVRSVLDDGVAVAAILTITFTDKAAAELRDRIRARLRELGAVEAARATEGAYISTIHGFCARLLRAQALAAGLDPAFTVIEPGEAGRLQDLAFEGALSELGQSPEGIELIASYGIGPLRGAIGAVYGQLRSRGQRAPSLPPLPPAASVEPSAAEVRAAAARVAGELGAIAAPGAKVMSALARLERIQGMLPDWPAELDRLCLPGGNGAALETDACRAYVDALAGFRAAAEHRHAGHARDQLDRLLRGFGERYAEAKRGRSVVDFEDLELGALGLLRAQPGLRDRYAGRFERIMVDELQDVNAVQLELIELLARDNLFTVGDARQSIYGFRHADVELFERRGERLAAEGRRATLQTNFRSRREILEVVGSVFGVALRAGREDPPAGEPLVELLLADKGANYELDEGQATPWRIAEARALAARLGSLVSEGTAAPGDIVVLTRATTDLRAYERALEERGVPTYVIGGRGYWQHPQVLDLVAWLRVLANPGDEEALYTVLVSPMGGFDYDELVVLAARAREADRGPFRLLCEDGHPLAAILAAERARAAHAGVEELIDRALEHTGYDRAMLAMPGGQRRLANVRKLMRLGREHEARAGRDLRSFLETVAARSSGFARADARESEAPVEGEALDAVRLMTIHRAKGLEFPIVAVADLGRVPRPSGGLLRVGRDGRLGIQISRPGSGKREAALAWRELGEEQREAEEREERRLFYVAMTRARERLILSGARRFDGPERGPAGWISDALEGNAMVRATPIAATPPAPSPPSPPSPPPPPSPPSEAGRETRHSGDYPDQPPPGVGPPPPVVSLSYSAIAEYERCGYRFHLERVLGLPPGQVAGRGGPAQGMSPTERGILVHQLLEALDFSRPARPVGVPDDVADLVEAFGGSRLCSRLARARDVRREERFAFSAEGVLITGALDVVAGAPGGGTLVVDYKTDREVRDYPVQRLIYALAALRAGAQTVEVAHVFLVRPEDPRIATFDRSQLAELEAELAQRIRPILAGEFAVSQSPCLAVCAGCPGEGGLCSWPLESTRREAPDRLF